eukprot:4104603-Amphidinium_carterae.1
MDTCFRFSLCQHAAARSEVIGSRDGANSDLAKALGIDMEPATRACIDWRCPFGARANQLPAKLL